MPGGGSRTSPRWTSIGPSDSDMSYWRYGVAINDETAHLSGIDLLREIVAGRLPQARMAGTLGLALVEVEFGRAVFEGVPEEHVTNPAGVVHGGWALTLIDSAAGCAAHSTLGPGVRYVTVETKGNLSRPILAGMDALRCEGRVIQGGRRVISAEAVLRDAGGKVMAHGTSTLLVLGAEG
jgi:uncharacterized protein (TIGR00369 family)